MVEIFGKSYYICFDTILDKCKIEKKEPPKKKRGVKTTEEEVENNEDGINIFKYELYKICIERLFDEFEEKDEELGEFGLKKSSISFKIAFNTLLKNKILIEFDDE